MMRVPILLFLCIILIGCGKNEKFIKAEKTAISFFKVIGTGDEGKMGEYYPLISTFDNYYKSDSIVINENKTVFFNDSIVKVYFKNHFTNGFGKKTSTDINLFIWIQNDNVQDTIIDSQGLTDYIENDHFNFAKNVGAYSKEDTTDILKNNTIFSAKIFALTTSYEILLDMTENCRVSSWNWSRGYGRSASGKGIVRNNSGFDIPNVKYEIRYTRGKQDVTTDDGYVSYDVLRSGQSKSFTFYTSYVGYANHAYIKLIFDEDMIYDYVLQKEYDGTEYETYMNELDESI